MFLLTGTQLIGSFVLALAIFLVEYSPAIIRFIEGGSEVTVGSTGKTVSDHVLSFLRYLSDLPHAGEITTGLFFAGAAVVIYLAFIALNNFIITIRNEIAVDMYVSKGQFAKVFLTRLGAKALAAGAFGLLVAVSIFLLIPYWMNLLNIFVESGLALDHGLYLLGGFTGLAANIYVVWTAAYFTWIYEERI